MKPQIIIFDGVDKTGKSTLKGLLEKKTNFFNWVIDRGPLSALVYNIVYNRGEQNLDINNITKICPDAVLIYCTANTATIRRRIANFPNEPIIDVEKDKMIFEAVLNTTAHMWKKVIMIDTTIFTPEESIGEIIYGLKDIK